MILETLLGIIVAGSAVATGAAMMTKDKDKIIKPTINNNINNNINNSINNSFNKRIETVKNTASNTTETKIKDSYNTQQTTQQSTEIDHDKIVDELYMRYKIDKNEENLNTLLEELNNL